MDGLNWGTYYFFSVKLAPEMPLLTSVMRAVDLAGTLPALAVAALIVLGLLMTRGKGSSAAVVLGTLLLGLLLIEGLNRAVGIARPPKPDESYASVELGPSVVSRTAFVSSFAYGLLGIVAARGIAHWSRRLTVLGVCVLIILAIGFSQLYLSLEFLTPLFAGWAAGAFALLACRQFGQRET